MFAAEVRIWFLWELLLLEPQFLYARNATFSAIEPRKQRVFRIRFVAGSYIIVQVSRMLHKQIPFLLADDEEFPPLLKLAVGDIVLSWLTSGF